LGLPAALERHPRGQTVADPLPEGRASKPFDGEGLPAVLASGAGGECRLPSEVGGEPDEELATGALPARPAPAHPEMSGPPDPAEERGGDARLRRPVESFPAREIEGEGTEPGRSGVQSDA